MGKSKDIVRDTKSSKTENMIYSAVKVKPIVYLIGFYFIIAPLEDILRSEIGTLSKYLAVLIIFVWLLNSKGRIRVYSENKKTYTFLFSLIILSWVSCLWSISLSTTISRNMAYTTLPLLFMVFGTIQYNEKEYHYIKKCITISVMAVLIVIFFSGGIGELLSGRLRLSKRNDPNNLAALLLLPFGISVDLFIIKKKIIYFVFALVSGCVLLLTGSRGGLLACSMFGIIYMFKTGVLKKPRKIILYLLILVAIYYLISKYLPKELVSRLFTSEGYIYQLALNDQTQTQRLSIWSITLTKIIPNNIIKGTGSGTAPLLLTPYYGFDEGVHNTFINMVVEYGVIGLSLFFAFIFTFLARVSKRRLIVEYSLIAAIMVVIVFLDSYPKKFFWNVLYLGIIALRTTGANKKCDL